MSFSHSVRRLRTRAASEALAPQGKAGRDALGFLRHGGEMGARMRALDWRITPLGAPDTWPQSLKTIVRVMLDSRYAMWMLWGPDKTFFCNDAYLPTVGLKKDWVLGAPSDRVWAEIWPDIGPRIDKVLHQGQATWDEALQLYLQRSGYIEETYHTFSYSPAYDDDGDVAGMLCVVTEVTERVVAERRLRLLRDLAARAAGVQSVQESCGRLVSVLAQGVLDVPFAALYLADATGREARRLAHTGEGGARLPETFDLAGERGPWPVAALMAEEAPQTLTDLPARGVEVPAGAWPDLVRDAVVLPLKGPGQGLVGFLVTGCSPRQPLDEAYRSFFDLAAGQIGTAITDAQAYEAERQRALALAELDRAKTAFFSNVSHEFRTPLTLMLGPLDEALADEAVAPVMRERLALAHRGATRLQRLVNSLLDFSRIEAGRVYARYEPTDLAALTRDLASTFRSAMDKAGLAYTVDCAPLPEPVYVDREMWEKIVLNLLSNAFKFTLEGHVALRLRADAGSVTLAVEDTGAGIPQAELPRLFERFHRVEGTRARTHEGSGIGLALVHELVKLHGGRIDAVSQLGQGSTLHVTLPLGHAHLPAERLNAPRPGGAADLAVARSFVDEALRWLPDAPQAELAASPASLLASPEPVPAAADQRFAAGFGARILLADDNADMRAYIRELLAPYYVVQTVADGVQALAAARRQRPDLIVSDVMMPNLDGLGLLDEVRADLALRSIPVVLLSARAGQEARIEGLDAGADDYIVKPFSSRELLARLGALLELRRLRHATEQAFRHRTAQFETLLNQAPIGLYLVDGDFRVREANPIARVALGGDHALGRDFTEVLYAIRPKPYADEIAARFRHTLDTGEPYVAPERRAERLDDGPTAYFEWQIHRIPLPDGSAGVVCYFRDVSDHVHARLKLETADRQKDEFLAMLAHELRNPLAPIRYAGEILSRIGPATAPAQRAVGVVTRQVANLSRLVDDLLDVSRITQGRVQLQQQTVLLSDVVAQAVETVEPLMLDKGHRLTVLTQGALRVHGDHARLVQCVANLLHNAAKYTDRGGHIEMALRAEHDQAVLRVSDDGIGISSALLPTVFDLFVQGDRTLDRAQGGLGIGLSVVQRLVDMHGGTVHAHSPGPGGGSTFEMRLPLRQADAVDPGPRAERPVAARRVLVVDDNVDAADALGMILGLDGHDVVCAYTPQDAIDRALACRPEVALLDIGLPGMDGYELARRLRALAELGSLRLVALTGYGLPEDRARALAAGFDEHLVKPPDHEALRKALMR